MQGLNWLTARPVAHRGLHDAESGIIENTTSAFNAAITANYAFECDLQITADGEAVVHHDDQLGRLTEGSGRLNAMTAASTWPAWVMLRDDLGLSVAAARQVMARSLRALLSPLSPGEQQQ